MPRVKVFKPPTLPTDKFPRFMSETFPAAGRGQFRDGRRNSDVYYVLWDDQISAAPRTSEILSAFDAWSAADTREERWKFKRLIRDYADEQMHKVLGYDATISGPQMQAYQEKERQALLVIGGELNPANYTLISNRATALRRTVAQEAADVKARADIYRYAITEIQKGKDDISAAIDTARDTEFRDVDYKAMIQAKLDLIIEQLP